MTDISKQDVIDEIGVAWSAILVKGALNVAQGLMTTEEKDQAVSKLHALRTDAVNALNAENVDLQVVLDKTKMFFAAKAEFIK